LGANSSTLRAGDSNALAGNTSTLLNFPTDVTFDPMGNTYVADAYNHRIQLFLFGRSSGSTIAGLSGISDSNSTMLHPPYSVKLDNQLNLYVADASNNRLQKI
jgi:hypothetical protein